MNPARIILLHTTPTDRPNGSMVRYGNMLRAALTQGGGGLSVEELNLSPRQAWLERLPAVFQTPVRYSGIALRARRVLPDEKTGILHLLDGSHAYLLGAVRRLPGPLVITVHDMIPALCLRGELRGDRPGPGAAWIIRRTLTNLARADAWVADSTNTRDDLIRLAGVDSRRVQVVHPAVTLHTQPPSSGKVSGAAAPYILHVAGNNNFYKNRTGVIAVLAAIRRSVPVRLKLVGAPPDTALRRQIESAGMSAAVDFLPNVSEAELAELYRQAAFLLFPSTYEGFGWPPLEAMACGCPVVGSAAGSLAEIIGAVGLTAAPDDVTGLAGHGLKILKNPAERQLLVEAGFRHVRRFSLEALSAGLLRVYQMADESFRQRTAYAQD